MFENGVEAQFVFSSRCSIMTMIWQPGLDETLEAMFFPLEEGFTFVILNKMLSGRGTLTIFFFLNIYGWFCAQHFSVLRVMDDVELLLRLFSA